MEKEIQKQSSQLKKGNPILNLIKPCRLNDGIIKLKPNEFNLLIEQFEKIESSKEITFFIPASGSGSRMFADLFSFINVKENTTTQSIEFIEQFLNNITLFPFYNKLPQHYKKSLQKGEVNIKSLIKFILLEEGLNFGQLPKGLIPFHLYDKFIINPFQEQILQGTKLAGEKAKFHFTINPKFESKINHSIKILKEITGIDFTYTFSNQDESTHAIAFNDKNKVIYNENNNVLLRPAGHGALLDNLNNVNSDLIFIKNIDNIQHFDKATTALKTKKALAGKLISFQTDVFGVLNAISNNSNWLSLAKLLNKNYELNIPDTILQNQSNLFKYLNKPIRICGMVKNEGQAGGGPFWVKDEEGNIEKQIIEKSQINPNQLSIMLHATHFNPVEIVCAVKDYENNKFDLTKYVNNKLYFIVNKTEKGQQIRYVEKPGLWNGAMYNWLTLFIDINSDCFSPVKTVLDLLKPLHQQE